MADDKEKEFIERLKKELAKSTTERGTEMVSLAAKLDDFGFIKLLETIAKIEPGLLRSYCPRPRRDFEGRSLTNAKRASYSPRVIDSNLRN